MIWLFSAALLLASGFWYLTRPETIPASDWLSHEPDPANGELFFHAGGCASCHETELGGGKELASSLGLFRVPNISPDRATGIGNWTTLEFVNAMMRGVSPDGRHYYPAFPYTSYARMKVRDVIDLKSYIDSLAPVENAVAGHELRFPWSMRRGVGLWKMRYLDPDPMTAPRPDSTRFERGRYLVEGAGHCGECHTPRDDFGGLQAVFWMAGGPNPDGDGKVPNITPHEDGLKTWSEADIAYYLKSGFTPDFDMVGSSMVKVQENMARLPDSDREAIAAYLKSIPARSYPRD
jgi:mono/diheme cytochrome c family protein